MVSATTRMLDDLAEALVAGNAEDVLGALGDAGIDVHAGDDDLVLRGDDRRLAVMRFLASFDDVAVTPVLRRTSPESAVEEVVVSGRHVGRFAGVDPTGERVRVNVSAAAVAREDGTVGLVRITPDMRALGAVDALAGETSLATASALVAAVRENEAREVAGWQHPTVAVAAPVVLRTRPRRSLVPLLLLLLVLVAAGGLAGWRWLAPASTPVAAGGPSVASTPTATPSSPSATPTPTPSPTPTQVPSIDTATPTVAPTVQAGRQLVLTSDVLFALGSAELTPAATRALLDLAAEVREADVSGTVQVNGYTDDVGSPASNVALSQARALAVARVLQPALAGMPVTLQPQGFGEASPVATNSTAAGRAKNRRVTVVLPRG